MHNITKRQRTIVAIIATFLILAAISVALLKKDTPHTSTGGSGIPEKGILLLGGYETPTVNSQTKTPVGKYLSTAQQSNIRNYLEALLYETKPLDEYRGDIVANSAHMNYATNVLAFEVKINDPQVTYTVHYTITGTDMRVLDEQGKELKPPSE